MYRHIYCWASIKSKADLYFKWWCLCDVWVGLISHPVSACGRLGRRLKEITGRSCTSSMSLTCSEKGNRGWRDWKGNAPFDRNGTPGGRKGAGGLWSWPLVSALGWPQHSIQPEMAGRGARCPQRAFRPHRSIMVEAERLGWGSAPLLPVISLWRQPESSNNKQKHTE